MNAFLIQNVVFPMQMNSFLIEGTSFPIQMIALLIEYLAFLMKKNTFLKKINFVGGNKWMQSPYSVQN
jgi:ABC-type xylose transport system permease subunit